MIMSILIKLLKLPYYFLIFLWCVFNAFLELFEKIAPYLTILYAQFLIALIMLLILLVIVAVF